MRQVTRDYPATQLAKRGGVYEFFENDGTYRGKICLVIGNNDRENDALVSILILSDNLDKFNRDCVDVPVSSERVMVARCGMVTYCRRSNLGVKLYEVSRHTMSRISAQIKVELGFEPRHHGGSYEEVIDYKYLYEDLLSRMTGKESRAQ